MISEIGSPKASSPGERLIPAKVPVNTNKGNANSLSWMDTLRNTPKKEMPPPPSRTSPAHKKVKRRIYVPHNREPIPLTNRASSPPPTLGQSISYFYDSEESDTDLVLALTEEDPPPVPT